MDKVTIARYVNSNLRKGDKLFGHFMTVRPIKIRMFLFLGPLAALTLTRYVLAVSQNGIYFHRLGLFGGVENMDYFSYSEIAALSVGKGFIQTPLKFLFANQRTLKVKACIKNSKRQPVMSDELKNILMNRIAIVS